MFLVCQNWSFPGASSIQILIMIQSTSHHHSVSIFTELFFLYTCNLSISINQESILYVLYANDNVQLGKDIKITGNTMIKINEKLFKSITIVKIFIESFFFGEKRLIVQIQIIKNCKTNVFTWVILYAKLAKKFFKYRY